jgi:hypothetical protein
MLPMLLMVTGFIYTKAQVTSHNPVKHVSVVYSGKQPARKVNSDSTVTAITHIRAAGGNADSIKITDGTLSSDKLVKDLLSSLHEGNSENRKIRP